MERGEFIARGLGKDMEAPGRAPAGGDLRPGSCRQVPTAIGAGGAQIAAAGARLILQVTFNQPRRIQMPVILWLLGVPLTVILLLMLFGVF